jgi:hypothetical protein
MITTGESGGTGELPLRQGSDLEYGGRDQSDPGQSPYKRDPDDTLEFQADLTKRLLTLRGSGQLAATSAGVMGVAIIWGWSGDPVLGISSLTVFSILAVLQLALRDRRCRDFSTSEAAPTNVRGHRPD